MTRAKQIEEMQLLCSGRAPIYPYQGVSRQFPAVIKMWDLPVPPRPFDKRSCNGAPSLAVDLAQEPQDYGFEAQEL